MAVVHAAAMETRAWSKAEFADLLATGAIALGDDRAFVLLRVVEGEAEILTLCTHPTQRRRGLARAALDAAQRAARSRGARCIFLEVDEGNAPAIALYRAAGYVEVGRRKGYFGGSGKDRNDAIVMRRML